MTEQPKPADAPKVDTRGLYKNALSGVGLLVAIIAALNVAFLAAIELTASHENPYLGIMAYAVVPAVMVAGMGLFILGMALERRRRRLASGGAIGYPTIDFNNPRHIRNFTLTVSFSVIFLGISVLGSYRAYHYTDSDSFCGLMCHQVMHPEYTAYSFSPHAKVGCVGCHVGEGAGWYVKSKMSGAYQLYATAMNKYPRPIPSPVVNLRPAQETCENCHWPEKFWGAQLKVFNHFGYDESNTPRETQMLIKTGGGQVGAAGIHWHMNIVNEIEYVASDSQLQVIPWVRAKSRDGKILEFFLEGDGAMTPAQVAGAKKRRMDCVTCHNRPTHVYWTPDQSVDKNLQMNNIDRTIPFIKAKAVEALSADYATTPEALQKIKESMEGYYKKDKAEYYAANKDKIDKAIAATQEIFQRTIFPEMKVNWKVHPNNIGHLYSAGCFRCHDNQHKTKDGKVLSKDCNVCHTVLRQQEGSRLMVETPENVFTHPIDFGDIQEMNCTDCHNGSSM